MNINKTKFMHFQIHILNTNRPNYDKGFDGIPLDKKITPNVLGITIDSHLRWNHHISNITSHLAK